MIGLIIFVAVNHDEFEYENNYYHQRIGQDEEESNEVAFSRLD